MPKVTDKKESNYLQLNINKNYTDEKVYLALADALKSKTNSCEGII